MNDEDLLLRDILNGENNNDPNITLTLEMFQHALLTKKPMVPHARFSPQYGMMLTRSAFAVMLKFSD